MISTSCQHCIFAQYKDKTQIGCEIGRLEKFTELGAEVVEAYNEEGEFYVIKKHVCMYCRHKDWGRTYLQKQWLEQIQQEIQVKYQVIILANNSLEDIEQAINSLNQQTICPRHITVIQPLDSHIKPGKIVNSLMETPAKWRVQTMQDNLSKEKAVDLAIDNTKLPYYCVVNLPYCFPANFSSEFNTLINESMLRFSLIEQAPLQIFNMGVHKVLSGNSGQSTLKEKIIHDGGAQTIFPAKQYLSCLT